jgi:hypothetical protein
MQRAPRGAPVIALVRLERFMQKWIPLLSPDLIRGSETRQIKNLEQVAAVSMKR